MTQDINNPKHYIAEEGMVFQRVNNGFNDIKPMPLGSNIYLGQILVDGEGKPLETPIDDNIEYYKEVIRPERKHKKEEIPAESTEENNAEIEENIENVEENA